MKHRHVVVFWVTVSLLFVLGTTDLLSVEKTMESVSKGKEARSLRPDEAASIFANGTTAEDPEGLLKTDLILSNDDGGGFFHVFFIAMIGAIIALVFGIIEIVEGLKKK